MYRPEQMIRVDQSLVSVGDIKVTYNTMLQALQGFVLLNL